MNALQVCFKVSVNEKYSPIQVVCLINDCSYLSYYSYLFVIYSACLYYSVFENL